MDKPETNPIVDAKPNTVPMVPADGAVLGTKAGYDPKPAEALRLFIVGPSGEGKTTFIMSIPRNHNLDFDDGANAVPGARANRTHIKNYGCLEAIIAKFVADAKAGNRHWDRVTFDTIDEMVGMIKHQLEKEKGVEDITEFGSQGHGYNLILERVWSKVMDLEEAGYTWAFSGHLKTKTEVNPATKKSETKIRESTYPSIAKKILTKSDFKLTVFCKPETVEEKEKVKLPGGQVIERPTGVETTIRTYYVDTFTSQAQDNKARGAPGMEGKFKIPLIDGWQEFKTRYDSAVKNAKEKYC